ncbi:Cyclin-B2-3 [Capsicum annuum]|uniref:Cyclin-B2-3 n=1 Tax=Capsicum annuum TaxID=4072 RepID=A0A2G2YX72_CAPAN|nr:Cyclin-B2-3 [Capsicum annuum]PHT74313.1 Cyclin-B2-3 [Capsicum annuum]
MFMQHTEAMMEEIDRMDEEIEMENVEDWSVVDIDSSDKKNELTIVEYIDDIYAYYKKAEVHYKFELMEETLYLNMNLINRFLAIQSVIRKKLQLVGITTLLLACKYEEVSVLIVEDLILIFDKAYARKEVLKMKAAVGKLTGIHRKYNTSKYDNASRCEPTSFLLEAWYYDKKTHEGERHALPVVVLNEIVDVCTTYVAPGSGEGGRVFLSSFATERTIPMRLSRSDLQEVDADAAIADFNKLKSKAIGTALFLDCIGSKPAIFSMMILCLFCKSKSKKLPLTSGGSLMNKP